MFSLGLRHLSPSTKEVNCRFSATIPQAKYLRNLPLPSEGRGSRWHAPRTVA